MVTQLGDRAVVKAVAVVAALVLAALWRRRWWIATGLIGLAFVATRELQALLQHLVDRQHPPAFDGG